MNDIPDWYALRDPADWIIVILLGFILYFIATRLRR